MPEAERKIVAYSKEGYPLPALSYSDNPEHVLGQRRIDEQSSATIETIMRVINGFGFYSACKKAKCQRLKRCCGSKIETSGARNGLYGGYPACFGAFREVLHETMMQEQGGR